ncbi:tetratricopeptide repeat protein [Nocardioides seonyuensis]|uniref:Tetratricopeptide repeat protein n=1 Tax=Nocardioides seonyuensis TaxID=2518371 RepID=A0A4P7IJ83_9ACTN|nr:tetratricopeptide repeat protein [Nocardioides seonyuensis]
MRVVGTDGQHRDRLGEGLLVVVAVSTGPAHPHDPQSVARGLSLLELGRAAEAENHFRDALAQDPTSADVLAHLARALHAQDRHEDSLAAARNALALDPGHLGALLTLSSALAGLSQWDAALDTVDRALQLAPDLPGLHRQRGALLLMRKRPQEALACLEHALRLDPEDSLAGRRWRACSMLSGAATTPMPPWRVPSPSTRPARTHTACAASSPWLEEAAVTPSPRPGSSCGWIPTTRRAASSMPWRGSRAIRCSACCSVSATCSTPSRAAPDGRSCSPPSCSVVCSARSWTRCGHSSCWGSCSHWWCCRGPSSR